MTISSAFEYGGTLLGAFAFDGKNDLLMNDLDDEMSLDTTVPGTVQFHRAAGSVTLLFADDMFHIGFIDFDNMLSKQERRLVAKTIAGEVTLHGCRMSRTRINPWASEVAVRFMYATLNENEFDGSNGALRLTYFIDTSKMNVPVGVIDLHRDDWPREMRVGVSGGVFASSEVDGDVLEVVSGPEYSSAGNNVNIRAGLMFRCLWQSGVGSDVWHDACERAKSLQSALAALVGYFPDPPVLDLDVVHSGEQSNIGKLLMCSDKRVKESPGKTYFLLDVLKYACELSSIGANWVSRYRKNIDRFREAVQWAEWDARFNRTTEHRIVNFIMAMETWMDDADGNTMARLSSVVGGDAFFTDVKAIGLDGFKDVVEQVVWCRNFITHRRPVKHQSATAPWDYSDGNVLHFISVSAHFLFYVHALRLCGLDIEAWHKGNPHGDHPLVDYVRKYTLNVRYAQGTALGS